MKKTTINNLSDPMNIAFMEAKKAFNDVDNLHDFIDRLVFIFYFIVQDFQYFDYVPDHDFRCFHFMFL